MKYEEPKMELVVLGETDMIVTSLGDQGDFDMDTFTFLC